MSISALIWIVLAVAVVTFIVGMLVLRGKRRQPVAPQERPAGKPAAASRPAVKNPVYIPPVNDGGETWVCVDADRVRHALKAKQD